MVQCRYKIFNITLTLIFLCVLGCQNKGGPSAIKSSSNLIIKQVEAAEKKITIKEAKPELDTIKAEASNINGLSDGIQQDQVKQNKEVTKLNNQIVSLKESRDKQIIKLNNQIASLKESNDKLFKSVIGWSIFAATMGLGVSIVLFFMGNLKSLTTSFICVGIIVGALLAQFIFKTETFWFIGIGIIITGGIVFGVNKFIKNRNITIKDLILTGEEVKKEMPDRFRYVANSIQQPVTKDIVDQVQDKLGLTRPSSKS